jgi:phage-related protein
MTIGFTTSTDYGSLSAIPDRGLQRSAKQKTRKIKFGDGYEQRMTKGINNTDETYNVSFKNRTKQDIDNIAGYLNSLNGITAFSFTVPDNATTEELTGILDGNNNEKTFKVVCEDFSQNYVNFDHYTLTANFRRVYES